jgi:mannose-6-phosphate isomerase-like protein (cupin superfamily)
MKQVSKEELAQFGEGSPTDRVQTIRAFQYQTPALANGKHRAVCMLGRTDMLMSAIQVFDSGGERVRHMHPNMDGFWFVLKGKARFYFDDGIRDLGSMEGVIIPRGVYYWFETVGEEPLQLLQVEAIDRKIKRNIELAPEDEQEMRAGAENAALFSAARN